MAIKREDDFKIRREHLKNLSEEELEKRFWDLAQQIVEPMVKLAYNNTSPSVERSVLLRMGFSSIEAGAIVDGIEKLNLLGKGAGNVVLKLAKKKNVPYREAGLLLVNGDSWDEIPSLFDGGEKNA